MELVTVFFAYIICATALYSALDIMKAVLFLKVSKKCKGKKSCFDSGMLLITQIKKKIVRRSFFCCSNHLVGIYHLVAAPGVGKKEYL